MLFNYYFWRYFTVLFLLILKHPHRIRCIFLGKFVEYVPWETLEEVGRWWNLTSSLNIKSYFRICLTQVIAPPLEWLYLATSFSVTFSIFRLLHEKLYVLTIYRCWSGMSYSRTATYGWRRRWQTSTTSRETSSSDGQRLSSTPHACFYKGSKHVFNVFF